MTTIILANGSEFAVEESKSDLLQRISEAAPSPWLTITLPNDVEVTINTFVIAYLR